MKRSSTLFLNNVRMYAKHKGIKIGDIEENAGVSPGYISRVLKDNRINQIGLETAIKMANYVGVSIEMFLSEDWAKKHKRMELEKQMQEIRRQLEELEKE